MSKLSHRGAKCFFQSPTAETGCIQTLSSSSFKNIYCVPGTLLGTGDIAVNRTKSLLNMRLMYLCTLSDSNMGSGGKECLGWRRVVFTIIYGVTKEDLLIESHLSRVMREVSQPDTLISWEKIFQGSRVARTDSLR